MAGGGRHERPQRSTASKKGAEREPQRKRRVRGAVRERGRSRGAPGTVGGRDEHRGGQLHEATFSSPVTSRNAATYPPRSAFTSVTQMGLPAVLGGGGAL